MRSVLRVLVMVLPGALLMAAASPAVATPCSTSDPTCDGVDDDCDGSTDEDFAPTQIACSTGACQTQGTTKCSGGKVTDVCPPVKSQGPDNTCNGIDDDCDGETDEGFFATTSVCGKGACIAYGKLYCAPGGTLVDSCAAKAPEGADANCDGIDDDCDGETDEHFVGAPAMCTAGTCTAQGVTACVDAKVVNACPPIPPPTADDTCDGIDDDCDGLTDEHYVSKASTCGIGPCMTNGSTSCVAGKVVDSCKPLKGKAKDDICNNEDDDCDGMIDEDFAPISVVCGKGDCAALGKTACVEGTLSESCVPKKPDPVSGSCSKIQKLQTGTQNSVLRWYFTVSQGGASHVVTPLDGAVDVAMFYGYQTAIDHSASTGFEKAERSTIMLYRDPKDVLSLVVVHDGHDSADGGTTTLSTSGLAGTLAVADDPGGTGDSYSLATGTFVSDWAPGFTDGFAVSDIQPTGCFTISYGNTTGLDGIDVISGDVLGERKALSLAGGPITVCSLYQCMPSSGLDLCDGIDDDCDGTIDEDFEPATVKCGVGSCVAEGTTTCVGGQIEKICTPDAPKTDDNCNGVDDDCDGAIDEEYTPKAVACGVGACKAAGVALCVKGKLSAICSPKTPGIGDALCDGIDEDCDGAVDEDVPTEGITCGIGGCVAKGVRLCVKGKTIDDCQPNLPAEKDLCNGVDDDCDGVTDEDFVSAVVGCGTGSCKAQGTTSCAGGKTMSTCVPGQPAAADASCDGIDDDCDGQADEDFEPAISSCGYGACAQQGVVTCAMGTIDDSCAAPTVAGNDATCNGIDDDCDGKVDEDWASSEVPCGTGPCTSTGPSVCIGGHEAALCSPNEPLAANDITCDGIDDDCDGTVDEDFVGGATSCGVGPCVASGKQECAGGKVVDTCIAKAPNKIVDLVCDGVDDDCDGTADDDYIVKTKSCSNNGCSWIGKSACSGGKVIDPCLAPTKDTTCDGKDDDCDGQIDEDFVGAELSCGIGGCERTVTQQCVAGQVVGECVAGSPTADDNCNGIDDDCDGATDEGHVGQTITCGLGACEATGASVCVKGKIIEICKAKASVAKDDSCDGVDDDCDGVADDNFVGEPIECVADGECGTGTTACVGGVVVEQCGGPLPELCDGQDNDCDGSTDEGADGVFWIAGQGTVSATMIPVQGGADVATFYGYGTTEWGSTASGLEVSERTTIALYQDDNGLISLIVLHDQPMDGSGGAAILSIEGLTQGDVVVTDDPAIEGDIYDAATGLFSSSWPASSGDGFAIEDVGEDLCITIYPELMAGIDGFDLVLDSSGRRLELDSTTDPITVCAVRCCSDPNGCDVAVEPPVVVAPPGDEPPTEEPPVVVAPPGDEPPTEEPPVVVAPPGDEPPTEEPPVVVAPPDGEAICPETMLIVSDPQTLANGKPATETWSQNARWTAKIPGATWIWTSYLVSDPVKDTYVKFSRRLDIPLGAEGILALLEVAADNSYVVRVNTMTATASAGGDNYLATKTHDIGSLLKPGRNTVDIEVHNWAMAGGSPYSNPAGLLYGLEVSWLAMTNNGSCSDEPPVVQPPVVEPPVACEDDPDCDQEPGGEPAIDATTDTDRDGTPDMQDNCPLAANPAQTDVDRDGSGDACDPCPLGMSNDADGDGVCDEVDVCPATMLPEVWINAEDLMPNRYADVDGDGVFETRERPRKGTGEWQMWKNWFDADRDGTRENDDESDKPHGNVQGEPLPAFQWAVVELPSHASPKATDKAAHKNGAANAMPKDQARRNDGPEPSPKASRPAKAKGGWALSDTAGCSCEQIAHHLGLSQKKVANGCKKSDLRKFVKSLGR